MKRMIDNSEELENLIFIANDIIFSNGNVFKLSESSEAKRLVKQIEYCYNNQVPLIIYEYEYDKVFVAINFVDSHEVYLHNLNSNINFTLGLIYDGQDTLSISLENQTFLTAADAPKMYRHQLTLNFDGEYGSVSLIVYSSSNLNVDSLEDLTTLLKPNSNTLFYGNTITSVTPYTFQIIYDNNVWKTGPMNEELGKPDSNITSVSDIVEEA